MADSTSVTDRIDRGIIRKVRQTEALKAKLSRSAGGGGVHESFASRKVRYPFFTYTVVSAPILLDWGADSGSNETNGTREIRAIYDLTFWSRSKVEAQNLDSILDNVLREKEDLEVEGQTVIHLQRISPAAGNGPDIDDEGRRYTRAGGSYEIWTTQPIPKST